MKTCTKCKLEKDESKFSKDKQTKDGLNRRCKSCVNEPYHNLSPEERTIKNKKYRPDMKILGEKAYARHKIHMDDNPVYKLRHNLRANINGILKGKGLTKNIKTEEILGCTSKFFYDYLESLFEPWMNWGNKGNVKGVCRNINETWDIDHIIPVSSTNTLDEVIKLCHYTNLRPFCSYTNRYIKRNKLDYD